jgi:hypothetical protein
MARAVSRRPLTVEPRVCAWSVHMGYVVGQVAMARVFLRVLRLSPVNIIPP